MFTLLARLFAGSFFKTATGEIAKGWAWLFSSATHILEAALMVSLLFGAWERHELHKTQHALASCDKGRKADQAAWAGEIKAANAATATAKQTGKDVAHDAQTYHAQLQADNTRLRDYAAAAHRVPRAPATVAADASSNNNPEVYADAPAMPTVAVPESVLKTCDDDYTYAAGAYQLGQDLLAKGLAVPGK